MVTDDRPFLIDSVTANCVDDGYTIEGVLHNTLLVDRNKKGELQSIQAKTKADTNGMSRESLLIITLQGILSEERMKSLRNKLSEVVTDVDFATRDWQEMRQSLQTAINDLDKVKNAPDKALFEEYKNF